MRRAYLAVLGLGALALLLTALTRTSALVYSPGVVAGGPAVTLATGRTVCQGPLTPPSGTRFDRVVLFPAAPGGAGSVAVRAVGGRGLGAGRFAGAAEDVEPSEGSTVAIGSVRSTAPIEVCLRATGPQPLTLLGTGAGASPTSGARVDGRPITNDVALRLEGEDRSLLALAPAMAQRAARFRPAGAWLYGVLAVLVLVAVPVLLLRALREAGAAVP